MSHLIILLSNIDKNRKSIQLININWVSTFYLKRNTSVYVQQMWLKINFEEILINVIKILKCQPEWQFVLSGLFLGILFLPTKCLSWRSWFAIGRNCRFYRVVRRCLFYQIVRRCLPIRIRSCRDPRTVRRSTRRRWCRRTTWAEEWNTCLKMAGVLK